MTILQTPATNTRQLGWDPIKRQYQGEISSTNGFGRVYDDACDEGMTLVSNKTGATTTFTVAETHRDADGDITYWVLSPVPGSAPSLADVRVVLFND